MIALSVSELSLSFGTDVILNDVSFSVNDGDRLGIIGVNGAGKTSLFRVISGEYTPDSGAVFVQKGHTVGVLEQNPDLTALPGDISCLEYMYGAFPRLIELEGEISRTEAALSEAAEKERHDEALLITERLNAQNTEYQTLGGLEYKSRCRGMLLRLGFDEELIN
jgi:ATP-binding cassette subfamily F protein 3